MIVQPLDGGVWVWSPAPHFPWVKSGGTGGGNIWFSPDPCALKPLSYIFH